MDRLLFEKSDRAFGAFATVLTLMLAIGCGGSAASVSGTISIDGKPLRGSDTVRVTVIFYPESSGAPAVAKLDENGQYVLSTGSQVGLPPGNYLVAISAKEITAPSAIGSPSARDLASPSYGNPQTSGFKAEVKPGANTFDYDLKSDPQG